MPGAEDILEMQNVSWIKEQCYNFILSSNDKSSNK